MAYFIFDDLAVFICLVEEGSITSAAKKMNLSRSTLSKRIMALEHELGMQLYQLDDQPIRLTAAGQMIYAKFANNIHHVEEIFKNTRYNKNNQGELIGTLRIAIPGSLMAYVLAPHLPDFIKRYPKVSLDIRYLNLGNNDLVNDQFDIAICNEMPSLQSVKIKTLGEEQLKLYAHVSYAKQYALPSSLEELKQHNVIGYLFAKKPLSQLIVTHLETMEQFAFMLNATLYFDNILSMQNLMKNGQYLSFFPSRIGQFLVNSGELLEVLPQYSFFSYKRYLVLNSGTRSHLEQEFVKFLEQVWLKDTAL
ncbi:MAG: LysR family transcriptional regulator [Burkholderiales bacterium]|nr:LysR family transcriptional regulator [Burkholderiales bacterium]